MNKINKLILTNLLIAILSFGFFRYVSYVFNVITPDSFSFDFEPSAVVNFIILVSVTSLGLTVFRQKKWTLAMAGVVGLVYLLVFGWSYINLVGVGIMALLFLYARHNGIEEIEQRTKINPRMIVRRCASPVVMALFLLISFAAFQSPIAKEIAEAEQLPSASQQMIRSIVDSVVGSQIPAGPEKESAIAQVTSQTFQQINGILKPYFQYAPPLLAFGLFLILWGLSWIFVWLSVLVGVGIFLILKKTRFVEIEKHNVEAEKLTI